MRDYGRVHSAIWSSPDFLQVSDDAKLLALYLLTSHHATFLGAFRLPNGYVCADLGWPEERVSKGLGELFRNGFCNRCETTNWLWIRRFLKWNPPENPNQWTFTVKQVEQIPGGCSWKADFIEFLIDLFAERRPEKPNPFERVTQTVSKQREGEGKGKREGKGLKDFGPSVDDPIEKKPKPKKAAKPKEPEDDETFERLWAKRPRRAGNDPKHDARKAFNARINGGADPAAIEQGLERYARFCTQTGKIDTEHVMRLSTFLGPAEPYLQDWRPPKRGAALSHANEEAIARAMGSP